MQEPPRHATSKCGLRPGPSRRSALVWFALLGLSLAGNCSTAHEPDVREVTLHAPGAGGPRVLVVVAHPDDEILFSGVLFKTAHHLGGTVDLLTLTNGEGGFKYSTLAEHIYGAELTREDIGRARLPDIRWRELAQSARILHIHRLESLGEWDHRYTQDVGEVLNPGAEVWNLGRIATELDRRLARGYDFVLTMAPTPTTHAHHQAATLLALDAVSRCDPETRPAILCARTADGMRTPSPALVAGYPRAILQAGDPLVFDRRQSFGHRERLHYGVLADMAIGAHLSQGTMQLLHGAGEREEYFLFSCVDADGAAAARAWFDRLSEPEFPEREYGQSAGTNAASKGTSR